MLRRVGKKDGWEEAGEDRKKQDWAQKKIPLTTVVCHFGRQHFYYLGKFVQQVTLMV